MTVLHYDYNRQGQLIGARNLDSYTLGGTKFSASQQTNTTNSDGTVTLSFAKPVQTYRILWGQAVLVKSVTTTESLSSAAAFSRTVRVSGSAACSSV